MKSMLIALAVAMLLVMASDRAVADVENDIRSTYLDFVEAQNTRDPDRIGAYFLNEPKFLWVSDGNAFWGREAVLARMGSFQKAGIWRVEPEIENSTVIEIGPQSAILHLPLTLVIGPEAKPDHLRFLVSLVFRQVRDEWKIIALLTTSEKP